MVKIEIKKKSSQNTDTLDDLIVNCDHPDTNEGFCTNCGSSTGPRLEFESIYSKGQISVNKNTGKCFETYLENVHGVSDKLKTTVIKKLNGDSKNTRNTNMAQKTFCQIYLSGAEIYELNPDSVVNSLNLKGRKLNQSIRTVSGTSKKSSNNPDSSKDLILQIVSISPTDCLKEICNDFDNKFKHSTGENPLIFYCETIKNIISKIIKVNPSILNERPKYIAVGFIRHYCINNNIPITNLQEIANISIPTLNQYTNKAKKMCKKYNVLV